MLGPSLRMQKKLEYPPPPHPWGHDAFFRTIKLLSILHDNMSCGAHWKHLIEMLPMRVHNKCFKEI